jgi:tetratricopeptide (TPR) repeat protein
VASVPIVELDLPARPERLTDAPVAAWEAPVTLPTYLPTPPSRYPAYLDRRVYQGSSGRVYPLPFHDRISETSEPHTWRGLHLENDHLRVLVLPELGGRIHYAIDKRTGYPMFYANPVIKPALVGLTGPWLAGGVELNWPQHHRPATFLPTAWAIEDGGAGPGAVAGDEATVWCSDHDPFARMKGMHGVRLTAGSTVLELRVRLFNRSDVAQTFLWWANVAAEVHADYQSFFPADVHLVADHAKRAVTSFPAASGRYYGVDYPARRDDDTRPDSPRTVPGDRLDWYRNIPVPTSYMCLDSTGDFFGGYDHRAQAGFVHWADHHVAVGKKQWSWGDAPFGHAWNRNLADDGSAYIELMAGVYTDNQPDFSHLAPGETKSFSQFWFPVAETGPVVAATLDAALGLDVADGVTTVTLDVTRAVPGATVVLRSADGSVLHEAALDLAPEVRFRVGLETTEVARVEVGQGPRSLLSWSRPDDTPAQGTDRAATEPPEPARLDSVEELYLTGQHLLQYRHATRAPEPYWTEALRRDPGHAPTHTALAARAYANGRFVAAEAHLRAAVARLTRLNPNPVEGQAHYLLGLTLTRTGREDEAYAVLARATWLHAWYAPASHQLAVIDARRGRDDAALRRVHDTLRAEPDQLQARNLRVVLLRRLGRPAEAAAQLEATLTLDPLDVWALQLAGRLDGRRGLLDAQTLLDVALENARIGELTTAVELFDLARSADVDRPLGQTAGGLLADYHAAVALDRLGETAAATAARARAQVGDRTWSFPGRLDDVAALEAALGADPQDPTAAALLGHWLYAHDRADEAIEHWRRSLAVDPRDRVVWRNLAVASFNRRGDAEGARRAYDRALAVAPADPQLVYESDQLLKRTGVSVPERLERLDRVRPLVAQRDDLSVEHAHLLLDAGRVDDALELLQSRRFQPWEGGEGLVLRAWERTQLALAARALAVGDPGGAQRHAEAALQPPDHLGEARHPLANPAEILLALGTAAHATGDDRRAAECWHQAAGATGDFGGMAPLPYSENTYYSVLAARAVGDLDRAATLTNGLADHVERLATTTATVDYFATSLPELLLFDDDPQRRQDLAVELQRGQLALLAGDEVGARDHLDRVLRADPSHQLALDLQPRAEPVRSMS